MIPVENQKENHPVNLIAPPCLGEALRRATIRKFKMRIHVSPFSIMMNAAAPEGTPPRRISHKDWQNFIPPKDFIVPPCLGEALRRVTLINFL